MTKNILIIGATSAIAEAVAREYAAQRCRLYLMARNAQQLAVIAQDLKIRGAQEVFTYILDVDHFSEHAAAIEHAITSLHTLDIVLIAHGILGNQSALEQDITAMRNNFTTNALSTFSLLMILAHTFEKQKQGTIAVITSVAGDRGRQSSYIYSAAKAAVSVFLQGLRHRLFASHVHVLDIKPGFVDTPMVAHLKKGVLWAQPATVARDIVHAIVKKRAVLYTPFFWRYIMFIIRNIPYRILHRTQL